VIVNKLRAPLAGYVMLAVLWTVMYRTVEGWSLLDSFWMVAISLSTIGYGEVHALSDRGRVLTMLCMLGGVSLHTYTLGQITRYIVEGGLAKDLRTRKRRREMERLDGHYVVVGLGRLGREVAAQLRDHGDQVVVIDKDPGVLEGFEGAATRIPGDASVDATMERAAIRRAKGLAVATGSTAINVFVTLTARELNPDIFILTRIDDPEAASKALRAGADGVISPYTLGGTRMAHTLTHPNASQFIERAEGREHSDIWIRDVEIGEGSPTQGTLRALNLRASFGITVVAIRYPDGRMVMTPGPDEALSAADVAVVAGTPESLTAFLAAARRQG